ncbi:MAG: hypothetical protein J2P29_08535 [Actinobacteria bacterium]|nr:hypothetical protein [Actinomycetota bacterium]
MGTWGHSLRTTARRSAGAALFPNATVTVQPGGGHYPWLDDPAFLATAINSFLT